MNTRSDSATQHETYNGVTMANNDQVEAAKAMLKAVYDDGFAEINGTKYTFTKMTHKERRSVCAYYTTVSPLIQSQQYGFMDTPEFERVEKIIEGHVTIDGSALSKLPEHWDRNPGDYLMFITTALGVISYPFFAGGRTD